MTEPANGRGLSRRRLLLRSGRMLGAAVLARHALSAIPAGAGQTIPDEPGLRGIERLQNWATGRVPKQAIPLDWKVYAPARGAAFYYPRDWMVTEIADPNIYDLFDGNPFGTWAAAPDQSAGVLLLNATANARVAARDAAWSQLQQLTGAARLERLAEVAYAASLDVEAAFVAARAGGVIGAGVAMTNPDTVMGGTFLYFQLALAKAELFDSAAEQIFLPMLQNLVTDGGSACDTDPEDDPYTLDDCPSVS